MTDENNTIVLNLGHFLNEERMLRISSIIGNHEKLKVWDDDKRVMRIATWNICSLFMAGRLRNEKEMNRINIDILELSEVRWPGLDRQKPNRG